MQVQKLAKGRFRHWNRLLRWYLGLSVALLIPFFLAWVGVAKQIDTQFALLGFDAERVSLLTSLLLTLISSFCAALLLQRCSPAWVGGVILFTLRFLFPFAQWVLHPGPDPAGQVQILNTSAFISVTLTILALSLLFAGAGAAIGKACGYVLLVPLVTLSRHLVARVKQSTLPPTTTSVRASLSMLLVGGLVVIIVILSVVGAGPLLTYGPTTNLYQPQSIPGKHTPIGGGGPAPTAGTLQSGTFNCPALGGIERTFWIYLPPSYSVAPARHYSTFYLLHGSPGGPRDWFVAAHATTTADALIADGKMREAILVGVDGNGPTYRFSEWANSFDGRQRMEDALTQDLVSFIDQHYRTLADATERVIGGLSMGGYGAVNIALHHPEIFHGVMSVGGYFQAEGPVFGTGIGNNTYRQLNSPSLLLQTPARKKIPSLMRFVIGVGTTDGRYYHEGMAFSQQLLTLGLHSHLLTDTGGHSWTLWAKQLGEALPLLEPASTGSTFVTSLGVRSHSLYMRTPIPDNPLAYNISNFGRKRYPCLSSLDTRLHK